MKAQMSRCFMLLLGLIEAGLRKKRHRRLTTKLTDHRGSGTRQQVQGWSQFMHGNYSRDGGSCGAPLAELVLVVSLKKGMQCVVE
jgi:hypothetical protein